MENPGSEPPRCPCGFFGSPLTLNLCSKCYKDELQRKAKVEEGNGSTASSTSAVSVSRNTGSSERIPVSKGESSMENGANSEKEGEENNTRDEKCTDGPSEKTSETPDDRPVQKNRKRCWKCKAKLELAQRELGLCKCEYVFCQLHRLPEQHECVFDHKESGRREAREKMVTLGPRKVGRSFQRIDE